MSETYLVCEGHRGSIDNRVLDRLVVQAHRVPVVITPSGGERGLRGVKAWLEDRSRPARVGTARGSTCRVVTVEDRNYRARSVAEERWADQDCRSLIWLRHEIENYLFEPRVVLETFARLRRTVAATWPQKLPSKLQDVERLLSGFIEAARTDHSAHLVHEELFALKRQAGITELTCPQSKGFDSRMQRRRKEWLSGFRREVKALGQACSRVANLYAFRDDRIEELFDRILARTEKMTLPSLLEEVDGHLLLRKLRQFLVEVGAPSPSEDDLAQEMIEALATEYVLENLFRPDEFGDLSRRLQ